MTTFNGDCLEVMRDFSDNVIDLLFCDLPYGETSCKWDCKINLETFWKEVNRICKPTCPMFFTTTARYGVELINSNPKNFRYDLVWVKSAGTGFLNAKKMPMRKHELIYVFYRKLPYYDLSSHKHKFLGHTNIINGNCYNKNEPYEHVKYEPPLLNSILKEEKNNTLYTNNIITTDLYRGQHNRKVPLYVSNSCYEPPLPNSILKEEKCYGEGSHDNEYIGEARKANVYEPPLPVSVIKTEMYDGTTRTEPIYRAEAGLYDPPLPVSIIKEEFCVYDVNKNCYGGGEENRIKISKNKEDHSIKYEPPLPNSIIRDTTNYTNNSELYGKIDRPDFMRKNNEGVYEPPLPNSILEIKSEKGKHATQKPIELLKWILKYYSKEGDTILDPTMGSGTTLIACKQMNRKYIGIEKDEKIYKEAIERISKI